MAYKGTDHIRFNFIKHDFRDKERNINEYVGYMLNRTAQMFRYDGLPETIPQKYIELYLQLYGCCAFAEHNGELYAFFGSFGGEPDPYYLPTEFVVANPYLNLSKNYKIDKDCVVLANDTLYKGLLPLFFRYATALAENDLSLQLQTINSRIPFICTAESERLKNASEQFFKDVENGKNGIVAGNEITGSITTQPYASHSGGRITDLIEYEQYLKASWYQEIGIQANFNMKREAINGDEADLNTSELIPLIDDMLENRKHGIDKVNEMFGTNISVVLSSVWANERKRREDNTDNEHAPQEVNTTEGDDKDENVS